MYVQLQPQGTRTELFTGAALSEAIIALLFKELTGEGVRVSLQLQPKAQAELSTGKQGKGRKSHSVSQVSCRHSCTLSWMQTTLNRLYFKMQWLETKC